MKRVVAIALLLTFPGAALAHDVAVWAEVVKGKVHVEAYFSDGTPVGDVPVKVTNTEGKVLLTGQTNAKGVFDFAPPAKTELTITVSAGGGHDSSARIKAKDLE
jgi:uncharacterized protein YfaS (alpha-2-macroglobulin family)